MQFSHITYAPGFTSETHPQGPSSFTDDEIIDAFFASYEFWVFNYAKFLVTDANAGVAILLLMFPYFQMMGRYIHGKTFDDREEFKTGFLNVFDSQLTMYSIQQQESVAVYLYKNLRCELAHGNLMGKGLALSDDNTPTLSVYFEPNTNNLMQVVINPRLWIDRIGNHVQSYKESLTLDARKKDLFLKYAKAHLKTILS